jgi:hypothetical protein
MEFDLQAALPQLLPKAIAWAEEQARRVSETGEGLSETGMVTARKVGVQHPELIRGLRQCSSRAGCPSLRTMMGL